MKSMRNVWFGFGALALVTLATLAFRQQFDNSSRQVVAVLSIPRAHFTLHGSGQSMPSVGLGTWRIKKNDVSRVVTEAIIAGYRHFDCAAMYGNEVQIGNAIKACIGEGLVTREDLFITSKLPNSRNSPESVLAALNRSLADLQLKYLDLYLIHWPVCMKEKHKWPPKADQYVALSECNMSNVWREFERAAESGLVRNIGVSNFSIKKLKQLLDTARIPPAVNQVESHPYLQQPELHQFCTDNNIEITAYSPIGSPGRPALNRHEGDPDTDLLEHAVVSEIARSHNATAAQVLLSWGVIYGHSVICKSSNSVRLRQNLVQLSLSLSELGQLAALDRNYRYHGDFWTFKGSPWTLKTLWDE